MVSVFTRCSRDSELPMVTETDDEKVALAAATRSRSRSSSCERRVNAVSKSSAERAEPCSVKAGDRPRERKSVSRDAFQPGDRQMLKCNFGKSARAGSAEALSSDSSENVLCIANLREIDAASQCEAQLRCRLPPARQPARRARRSQHVSGCRLWRSGWLTFPFRADRCCAKRPKPLHYSKPFSVS